MSTLNLTDTLTNVIAEVKGATFVNLTYTNAQGETSLFNVTLGADTGSMYQKDIEILTEKLADKTLSDLERLAATELLASRQKSLLNGIGSGRESNFVPVVGAVGVSINPDTGDVLLRGKVNSKTVVTAGAPTKPVKSAPKTLAKQAIEKSLPSSKLRTFKMSSIEAVNIKGIKLTK